MKRHEITADDVAKTPVTVRLASAAGPIGYKSLEVAIDLRTMAAAYIVNKTLYANLQDAIAAYNEAPGP